MKKNLLRVFYIILSVIFSLIFFGTIFDNKSLIVNINSIYIILSFIITFIILFFIYFFIQKKVSDEINWKKELLIFGSIFFTILIIQLICAYYLRSYPAWDWNDVYSSALSYVKGIPESVDWEYFQKFPNNNGMLYSEIILFKILKLFNLLDYSLTATIMVNIILIDISIILLYFTIRNLFGVKNAIFSLVLVLFSSAFFNYIPILYTDTVTMLFPIGILFFYSLWKKSNSNENSEKNKMWIFILITILCTIGIKIKFTCIIMLIAIIIDIIMTEKIQKYIKPITILLVSFAISFFGIKFIESQLSIFPYDINNNNKQIPYSHWIMMGLYERESYREGKNFIGWYDPTAYEFTLSFDTTESRKNANIKKIKEIISDYGFINYSNFLYRKMLFTWSDGTYYAPAFLRERPIIEEKTFIANIFHSDGKYIKFTFLENTGYILFLYFMIIIGAIAKFKYRNDNEKILKENSSFIALFGVIVFFLMWEASSRYLINYVPVMIVASIFGISKLYNIIENKIENIRGLK